MLTDESRSGIVLPMNNVEALLEEYLAISMKHSLDGTTQFAYAQKQIDTARAKVVAADPHIFARREAETLSEARARLGITDPR